VPINLGTAATSAFYLGSTSVSKIYLGSTQVFPVVTSGAAFYNPNTIWNGIFTASDGTGIETDKYRKSVITQADGMSIFITAAGTVRVTASRAVSDPGRVFTIYKNTASAYTRTDNTSGDGFSGSIPESGADLCAIGVNAGDSITFGVSEDFMNLETFRMWWTA
jgi:hypothetical protein